jgi:hypothetical protein
VREDFGGDEVIKDPSLIPRGHYCYSRDRKTGKRTMCPYWVINPEKFDKQQENGYCHFMEAGDGDIVDGGLIYLLWDQVKECGENL